LFAEHGFAGQLDLTLRVDIDDLHQHLIAFGQLALDVLDSVVGDLGNVDQAIGAGQDLHEGSKVDNPLNLA
jgi:hypothetical protein